MLKYNFHLLDGLFFELIDTLQDKEYQIKFTEEKGDEKIVIYETSLKKGMWSKISRKYLGNYFVEIWDRGMLRKKISFLEHIQGKRVFISYESKSLGDSIAWIPYCLEFQEKYKCEVVVSTFLNFLFEKAYPKLKFVGRGVVVNDIVAMVELGWFYDDTKEPENPATIPLQKAATNILALEFKEIKADVHYEIKERPISQQYVCISIHSTSGLKYWTREGWQDVINYLTKNGIQVIEISKEHCDFENVTNLEDTSLENAMNYIHHSELFIGLSSGLSWLSWAMGKKVIMISNFTNKEHEFTSNCVRIINESVCHGCWNNPMFKFDKGNWQYCPEHEDTSRHFECHRSITSDMVIEKLGLTF